MGALESPVGLQEHLRQQARTVVSGGDYFIADYLIANINDRGLPESQSPTRQSRYGDGATSEAAEALGVPVERVEAVLGQIQTLDPPGVGGRSPQECLLIQLHSLAEDGKTHPRAESIVRDHWRALASHQYCAIARALRCTPGEVDEAVSFIRANLDPYPGRQYRPFWQSQPGNPEIAGRPDILLRRELDEYQVEVAELDIEVRLSEAYARLRSTAIRATRDFSTPEGRIALDSLRRAEWFLQSLQMRRDTLRAVAEAVVIAQRGFLDTGSEESLKPLTRAQVASRVGKHESTVSRAIAGKFVLLPNGSMVPFEKFFAPAASPKSVIRELIERETPDNPLTDEQLDQALAARGFRLARRTVTKYRLALKIPSSDQRGRR